MQTDSQDQGGVLTKAIEGGAADSGFKDDVSRTAGANVKQLGTLTIGTPTIAVAQVERLTLDTAADGDTYSISIGKYTFGGTTSGSNAEAQRDAILVQMALNEDFVAEYTAVAQSTDSIDVTAVRKGTPMTVDESVTGGETAQIDTLTIGTPTIAVQQKTTLTITTAATGDVFTIKINGVTVATGTSSGTDKTVQRDAIEALLEANDYFNAHFTSTDNGTDALDIEAIVAGEPFTMEETVESTSAWDITEDTANIVGTQFKFTMDDKVFQYASETTNITTERDALLILLQGDTDFDDLVTFAASSTNLILVTAIVAGTAFTMTYANESPKGDVGAGTVTFTTTTPNVGGSLWSWAQQVANTIGTQFKIIIDGRELLYGAGSTSIETERDALLALLQADDIFATEVDFDESGTTIITITAATAGDPHTVTYQNENGVGVAGAGTVTLVATTANVTGNPVPFGYGLAEGTDGVVAVLPSATGFLFAGIAMHVAKQVPNDGTGAKYEAGEAITTRRRGRVWVKAEETVAMDDDVYLRHTLGAATELPGRFRTDSDSAKADQISNARWVTPVTGEGLAQIELFHP